jgi:hypothetical protein
MPSRKTPWESLVTLKPEPFGFAPKGRFGLAVVAGTQKVVCQYESQQKPILQQSKGRTAPVKTYSLRLASWKHAEPPILRAHPFLVPHLLSSRQMDAEELYDRVTEVGSGIVRVTVAITEPCPILIMMRLKRCALTFSTNFNMELGKA